MQPSVIAGAIQFVGIRLGRLTMWKSGRVVAAIDDVKSRPIANDLPHRACDERHKKKMPHIKDQVPQKRFPKTSGFSGGVGTQKWG